jgi:hypothetical protein
MGRASPTPSRRMLLVELCVQLAPRCIVAGLMAMFAGVSAYAPETLPPSSSSISSAHSSISVLSDLSPYPPLPSPCTLLMTPANPLRFPPLHLKISNVSPHPISIAPGILLTICMHPSASSSSYDFSNEICLRWLHPLLPPSPSSHSRPFIPRPNDAPPTGALNGLAPNPWLLKLSHNAPQPFKQETFMTAYLF